MLKSAAVYLRVSTVRQSGEDRFGLDVQREMVLAYASLTGLRILDTYQDAISGKTSSRAALDGLLAASGRYETIIISSVDRLARRVRIGYAIVDELLEAGFEIHSTDMGVIDLEDDSSSLNFGIRSVFAENDHRRLVRKLQHAIRMKVAGRDGQPGQPVRPLNGYGYAAGQVDETQAQWVRWLYKGALTRNSYDLANELNHLGVPGPSGRAWCDNSIRMILRKRVYHGLYEFGVKRPGRPSREVVSCPAPAIVTQGEWERAREAVTGRTRNRRRSGTLVSTYWLMGRVTCSECGAAMSGNGYTRAGVTRRYYSCHRHRDAITRGTFTVGCAHRTNHRVDVIHDAVLRELRAARADPGLLMLLATPSAPPRPVDTRGEAERVRRRLENARSLALDGALSPVEYRVERETLEAQLAALNALTSGPVVLPMVDAPALQARLSDALQCVNPWEAFVRVGVRVVIQPDGDLTVKLDA